jgi:hypothetical protein
MIKKIPIDVLRGINFGVLDISVCPLLGDRNDIYEPVEVSDDCYTMSKVVRYRLSEAYPNPDMDW